MTQIDGFIYESHSKSSSIARRNFRNATRAEDFHEAPHRRSPSKKSVKKKSKVIRGCPGDNYGPHTYVLLRVFVEYNAFGVKYHRTFYKDYCVGCFKPGKGYFRDEPEEEVYGECLHSDLVQWYNEIYGR